MKVREIAKLGTLHGNCQQFMSINVNTLEFYTMDVWLLFTTSKSLEGLTVNEYR